MTNEEEKGGKSNRASTFLDVISGKIGKIGAVVVVLATLVGGFATFMDGVRKIKSSFTELFGGGKNGDPVSILGKTVRDCVKVVLLDPDKEISIDDWNAPDQTDLLRLKVENTCDSAVGAFVSFRPPARMTKTAIIIEPLNKCSAPEISNPDCWEKKRLEKGEVVWSLDRPLLRQQGEKTSGEVIEISVRWSLYDTDKVVFLDSGKRDVKVRY